MGIRHSPIRSKRGSPNTKTVTLVRNGAEATGFECKDKVYPQKMFWTLGDYLNWKIGDLGGYREELNSLTQVEQDKKGVGDG